MMLSALAAQLISHFPPSMQKDVKTAVRQLAAALQYPSPEQCPPEAYRRPLAVLAPLVEAHLRAAAKSEHTIRNTKNLLSRLLRLAASTGLLVVPAAAPRPTFPVRALPARSRGYIGHHTGSMLPRAAWPPALEEAFAAFAHWALDPLSPTRQAAWKKRPITLVTYQSRFEAYFGYLHHVQHVPLPALRFDHLFEFSLVAAYVHWDVNEFHHRPTAAIHSFLTRLLALTRQYRPLPEFRSQLLQLKRSVPAPPPVLNKRDAWVSLDELDRVGQALWPQKSPAAFRVHQERPYAAGAIAAVRAGKSLMLRLWTYRPYRQRNMREMALGDNLYQDAAGHWRIRFAGEQLKVAVKQGQPNVFDLPFPTALVPQLEAYLQIWRPLLTQRTPTPSSAVFLSRNGTPFGDSKAFRMSLRNTVYAYTGQLWHPHIVRTVWATEWIRSTGNFYKAAIMLNDTLDTVIKTYAHLLDTNVADEVDRWRHTPQARPHAMSDPEAGGIPSRVAKR